MNIEPLWRSVVGYLVLFCALHGCVPTGAPIVADSAPNGGSPRVHSGTRLMIKWRDTGFDPTRPVYVRQLQQEIGVVLHYIRPMSGEAHVLRLEGVTDPVQVQTLVNRLQARPEIEYVEIDSRIRHMKQFQ